MTLKEEKKRPNNHDHLGQDDTLEKEMATHSSNLAWEIPADRGAWWNPVHGVRVGHD